MRAVCPLRVEAHKHLSRLWRAGLWSTPLCRMLAREMDRDLLEGDSRLRLALPKAAPLMAQLEEAGRSRPRRRAAKAAIGAARMKVR